MTKTTQFFSLSDVSDNMQTNKEGKARRKKKSKEKKKKKKEKAKSKNKKNKLTYVSPSSCCFIESICNELIRICIRKC